MLNGYVVQAASVSYGRTVRFGGTDAYIPAYIEVGQYFVNDVQQAGGAVVKWVMNGQVIAETRTNGAINASDLGYDWSLDQPTNLLERDPLAAADYIAKMMRRGETPIDPNYAYIPPEAPVTDPDYEPWKVILPITPSPAPVPALVAYDIVINTRFGLAATLANSAMFYSSVQKACDFFPDKSYLNLIYNVGDELHINVECNPIPILVGILIALVLVVSAIAVISWSVVQVSDNKTIISENATTSKLTDLVEDAHNKGLISDEEYKAYLAQLMDRTEPEKDDDSGGILDFLKGDNFKWVVGGLVVLSVASAFKK